jgi:hypothetical protein
MTLQIKDRVKETTATTGTGALALSGAMTGFSAFSSACSVNDTCYYCIQAVDSGGAPTGDWEVGLGTYSAANTLTRTTVLASSNAGAAVNFAAGTKQVWIDLAASQAGLLADPTNLTWDRVNNILYVGPASGSARLQGLAPSSTTSTGTSLTVQGGSGGSSSGQGGDVTIKSGVGNGASWQGNLYLYGADASAGGGRGGSITIQSGFSGNSAGAAGGDITIKCGSSYFSAAGTITIGNDNGAGQVKLLGGVGISQQGGQATVQGGTGSTGGSGGAALVAGGDTIIPGQAIVRGGDGGNQNGGGSVTIRGGNSTQSTVGGTTVPGNVTVKGGDAGGNQQSAGGGSVTVTGGQGGNVAGAGGNVTITGGAPQAGNGGAVAIAGAAGVGTNKNGGSVTLTPGAATGTGTPGNVVLNGSGAALATTAIGGFTCLPTCAGTPTGTPASVPVGTVPMVYDSTKKALYAYVGSAWKNTTLPALTTLKLAASQSITQGTWVKVSYDTNVQDDVGAFSSSTPTQVTVPTGYTRVRITSYIVWAGNNTGSRYHRLSKNNVAFRFNALFGVDETGNTISSGWITVAAGDVLDVQVLTTSTTLNIAGSGSYGSSEVQYEWA